MGCDIHGYYQKRSCWPVRDPDTHQPTGEVNYEKYNTIMEEDVGRNYFLFALLADVRNGYGLTPISEPRGLPNDIGIKRVDYDKDDNRKEIPFSDFDFGEHSQSWVTITEVMEWVKNNPTMHDSGYVEREEYEACIAEGRTPNSWCGDVGGGRIIKTSHKAVADGTAPEGWNYAYMEWENPTLDRIGPFYKLCEYFMAQYSWELQHDPAAVRFVFGFDS